MVSQNNVSLLTMCIAARAVARPPAAELSAPFGFGSRAITLFEAFTWRVHHDVFRFARLNHALNTGQQFYRSAVACSVPFHRRAESDRL